MNVDSQMLPLPRADARDGEGRTLPTLVIQPPARFPAPGLRELWAYRGLFFFLVWRDVKVRYSQTVVGAGWALLQPLLNMVVFTIVFGRLARLPSDGVPYPVFALSGLVMWTYFSSTLNNSSGSLVSERNLITKVYFPRLVIPMAPVAAGLVDLGVAMLLLLTVMLAFGMVPAASAVGMVPLVGLLTVLTVAGAGCWLSALNLKYRDFRFLVPFMLQVWMYASPIVYPASLVPERYRVLYALNPMVGVVEGLRAGLFGHPVPWAALGVSAGAAVLLLVTGVLYFRYTERVFADLV
jgi:lipopolysaccharide transport system permease protein